MYARSGFGAVVSLVLLFAVALGLPACGAGTGGSDGETASAAEIRIVDLPGLEAALEEYRGRGVLLNFWAIWCAPCVAELPELLETGREFADRGGVVVTVSYDLMIPGETRDTVRPKLEAFTAERGIDVPVLVYEADDHDAINDRFRLPGEIPVTLAIDKTGKIVDRQFGAAGKSRFDEMMRQILP